MIHIFYFFQCNQIKVYFFHHQFVVAQLHTISTDSPVVVLGQVSENDLHSGSSSVEISCNLVSLNLMVCSHSADEDGYCRSDGVGQVLGLEVQTIG